jgi:hypothetical protein
LRANEYVRPRNPSVTSSPEWKSSQSMRGA